MNLRHPLDSPRGTPPATPRLAAFLLALLCGATAMAATGLSSVGDFNAGKARAEADLLAERRACNGMSGHPHDVCREQARGKERVTKAELELAHTGTRKAQDHLTTVRLDTAYDLARTQCNDKTGSARSNCAKEAQSVRSKAQADLMQHRRVTDARRDGAEDGRETDDKLGAETCDAMAADARAACIAAARAKAGKR